ncbi:hypothetical protein [Tenacibaculum xiamenense]|uniref:hypothetical protein n=1 Tax=Tenacibaculum xiamenense TaxID=1261553 RepID=UPI0038951903
MKKLLLFIGFVTLSVFAANAQDISKNAIGVRFGENNGFGGELSYQRRLSDNNRLEANLGIRGNSSYSAFKVAGLYQWVWQLEDRFNWYVGAGGGLGNWKTKATNNSDTFIFGAGVIGIEYNFDIPLLISLDFRPEFGFSDTYDGFEADFGLAFRYQF